MIFIITLESRDNNVFKFSYETDDVEIAKSKALETVEKYGWDMYEYKIIDIKIKDKI